MDASDRSDDQCRLPSRYLVLKIECLYRQITNIKNILEYFKYEKELQPITDLINDEITNSISIIKEKELEMRDLEILMSGEDIPVRIKHIFTRTINILGSQEIRLASSEDMLSHLSAWKIQRKSTTIISQRHTLLEEFCSELCQMIGIQTPIITNFGTEFKSIPCTSFGFRLCGYIINIPETVANEVDSWPILAHELGHVYFDENEQVMKSKIKDPLEAQIRSMNIKKNDENEMVNIWNDRWVPELISDLIATLTLGPAYVERAMVNAFGTAPLKFGSTDWHPPWKLRIELMMKTMKKINLRKYHIEKQASVWNMYDEIFEERADPWILNLLMNQQTVKKATDLMTSSIQLAPIRDIWCNVLRIMDGQDANRFCISELIQAHSLECDQYKKRALEKIILAGY